jgi:hypothetical protein
MQELPVQNRSREGLDASAMLFGLRQVRPSTYPKPTLVHNLFAVTHVARVWVYPWLGDPDETVGGRRLSSACHGEDALSATAYLALKYCQNPARGLDANINLGVLPDI